MDYKSLIKWLRSNRYELYCTGKSHVAVHRDGRCIYVISSTPSDYRGLRNTISALRRAGIPIPRK